MAGHKELPKANFNRALSYMVKSYVGAGCLSLPLAFQHAGVTLGMVMLSLIFLMALWNLRSLTLLLSLQRKFRLCLCPSL